MIISNFALSQVLIAVAGICDLVSFQFRRREAILAWLTISSIFISSHFFILGNSTAGCLSLLTSSRLIIAYFSSLSRWVWIFSVISLLVFGFTYQTPINILPLIAAIMGAVGAFQSNDQVLRKCIMVATLAWMIHNALIGSPGAFVLETIFLGSNLLGYWRFYLKDEHNS